MNKLIAKMAEDMKIEPYDGELQNEFNCRVIYSALGLWCLTLSENKNNGIMGITKRQHSIMLRTLIDNYFMIEPKLSEYLTSPKNGEKFYIKIRELYENTGYLLTDETNKNRLSYYERQVSTGSNNDLYIGIPKDTSLEFNGLGVFCKQSSEAISVNEFIMRDNTTNVDYIKLKYDICDFENRDIDNRELEFFNPLLKSAPYQSWGQHMETDFSIARKGVYGPYYRVMRSDDEILYFEQIETEKGLYAEEFRRLYFALRKHYENPQPIWVIDKDGEYVELQLTAKLPTREYCLLLLSAWPISNAFNSQKYLLKKNLLPMISSALNNIDVYVKEF